MGFTSLVEDGMLQVQVAEIPKEGLAVKVAESSWFPEQEVARQGGIQTEVFISRSVGRVFISGSIDLVLLLRCDRCLAEYELPEKVTFRVIYDLDGENPARSVQEFEWDKDEMDVVFLKEPAIDLSPVLAQQVILAVPQKKLCRSDCAGFCQVCGECLNTKECNCLVAGVESPFALLGQLVTKK